jgi:hypothetical protein
VTSADLVLVPSAPALLPGCAGLTDPVADVRAACRAAVSWLAGRHPDRITVLVAGPRPDNAARGIPASAGERIARHLLADAGFTGEVAGDGPTPGGGVLAVANGSATRGEKAPGHLDERSFAFDAAIGRALREGRPQALCAVDDRLGEELWAHEVSVLHRAGAWVAEPKDVVVDFDGDPFGVQYWVVRWSCGS